MWAIGTHFNLSATEPITESDYRAKEAEARSELIGIDECAMQVAEYHHAYDEADYEDDGENGRVVTDEAWYRVRDQKRAELRALAEAGTLASSGKGKRLKIACGSFHDWLGEPVPVPPDFGLEFEVNWRELRAIEEQFESIIGEFDGEDVLHPRVRGLFDEAKAAFRAARQSAGVHGPVRTARARRRPSKDGGDDRRTGGHTRADAVAEPEQDLANVRLLIAKAIEKGMN
jgi:hypothetical protein